VTLCMCGVADDEIKKYTAIVAEKAPVDLPLADKGKGGK
jgi:hypothetical protein